MKNIFFKEHQLLLEKLINAGVKFIIVGGYAVNYHGYNRTTGDLDLWIKPDSTNRELLLNVLSEMGFNKDGIEFIQNSDFDKPFVFNIWERPYKVDFMTKISGITYEEADKNKVIENFQGLPIPFLDLQHLVVSKMTTNRLRDRADVEELQKIMKLKGQKTDR
jgi:predicted nucleotidyltransferase